MAKSKPSIGEQLLHLGLTTAPKVRQLDDLARKRWNRECLANALRASERVESDLQSAKSEYREHRALARGRE